MEDKGTLVKDLVARGKISTYKAATIRELIFRTTQCIRGDVIKLIRHSAEQRNLGYNSIGYNCNSIHFGKSTFCEIEGDRATYPEKAYIAANMLAVPGRTSIVLYFPWDHVKVFREDKFAPWLGKDPHKVFQLGVDSDSFDEAMPWLDYLIRYPQGYERVLTLMTMMFTGVMTISQFQQNRERYNRERGR